MAKSPVPHHLGIVVADLDIAMDHYRRLLDVGPWAVRQTASDAIYRERTARVVNRMAMARHGSGYLELLQPVSGASPAAAFLRDRGEGPFHLAYLRPTLTSPADQAAHYRVSVGGRLVAVYLDTLKPLGLYVEHVHASQDAVIRRWVDEAAEPAEP